MMDNNNNFSSQLAYKIDHKTKPLGALGKLEGIAGKIATIQNTLSPRLIKPTIAVFAGDHGIAREGVSAYPQEVTYQMVMNFLNGGAAINIFSHQNGIDLAVIDSGVNYDFNSSLIIDKKVGYGTDSFLLREAMTEQQLDDCLKKGREVVGQLFESGTNVIGFGEMGIGNTSSASMLMAYLSGYDLVDCIGRGSGVNGEGLKKKIDLLCRARDYHGEIESPKKVLQVFGGFEIAQMTGAMLEAFNKNMILLIDGFISTSAFLVAFKSNPAIINNAFFSHMSNESGHKKMLEYLKAEPILNLGLRLGEGTGCALAYPIIKNAVTFLNDMASFESAGVSDKE